jgi:hypothetical protein
MNYVTCPECFGSGKKTKWIFWTKDCPECAGRGKVLKHLHLTIPRVQPEVPRVATTSVAPQNDDDSGIALGTALLATALTSGREDTVTTQAAETPFKGDGGEFGGAGASSSWNESTDRTSEPASEPAASDSSGSSGGDS